MNLEARPITAAGWAILHKVAEGDTDALAQLVGYFRDPHDAAGERWQFLRVAERDAWTAVEILLLRKMIERRFSEGVLDAWMRVTPLGLDIRDGLTSFFDSHCDVKFPAEPRSFGAFAFQELCAARLAGELEAEVRETAGTPEEIMERLVATLADRFPLFAQAIRNTALDMPGIGWGILDWRIRCNFETLVALPTDRTPPPNHGLEDLVVLLINCPTTVERLICDVYADGEFARRIKLAEARNRIRDGRSEEDRGHQAKADAASFVDRVVPIRAATLAEAVAAAEQVKRTKDTLVAINALWDWYTALPLDQRKALGEFKSKHDLWITARFRHRPR